MPTTGWVNDTAQTALAAVTANAVTGVLGIKKAYIEADWAKWTKKETLGFGCYSNVADATTKTNMASGTVAKVSASKEYEIQSGATATTMAGATLVAAAALLF
jgi:hypothetical protein